MSAPRRPEARPGGSGGGRGILRALAWLGLLLGSLFLVIWRQTRGVALEGQLREVQGEQAVVEAERVRLVRRIEELRSRSRIVRVARERLDMRLPEEGEIVFLPVDARGQLPSEPREEP